MTENKSESIVNILPPNMRMRRDSLSLRIGQRTARLRPSTDTGEAAPTVSDPVEIPGAQQSNLRGRTVR
jgi:hypothetical protein